MLHTSKCVMSEDVHGLGLRIRIYGCERMRRQRLLGEAAVSFAALNLELENNLWLDLAPRHHQPAMQVTCVFILDHNPAIRRERTDKYTLKSCSQY